MSAIIIEAEQVAPQAWRNGGGQTRELLVWPPTERPVANPTAPVPSDWQLRISRADIEADGPFSAFAGVQRWFVVISGKGVVLHMPTTDGHAVYHHLMPGHTPLHFDGGLAPGCNLLDGPTQDLNLMARGGVACMQAVDAHELWSADFAMRGLYTACSGVWSNGLQSLELPAHSLLWDANADPKAVFRFTQSGTEPPGAWWLGYTPDTTP